MRPIRHRFLVWAALLSSTALLATSCGTRVDRAAYFRSLQQQGQGTDVAAGAPGDAAQQGVEAAATNGGASGGTGGAESGAASAGKGAKGSTAAAGSASGKAGVPTNVSTAVVGDTIRVGLHVPETGAAPLPQDWMDVVNVVQGYLNAHPVNGRKMQFVVEDDGYDPAMGLAACRKLAGENVVFVIGHTQPAVEDACAGLFQSQGIPYLMRGAQPQLLSGRSLAWFGTIPDDIQGDLLGDYVIHRLSGAGKKSAVVYENDQTAAKDGFVSHVKGGGGNVVASEQSQPRQPDYAATIQKLQSAGAQFVFLSMPPVDAIKISVQAQGQGFHPTWLGGGTYWNYNMVLQSAGMALDGAISFSPWPAVDSAAASDYRSVYAQARPGKDPPDIGLIVWGWAMLVRQAVENAGSQLSRASFVSALNALQFSPPYWNPIAYTSSDHRGANAVAVFRADGQAKRWQQIAGFSSGF